MTEKIKNTIKVLEDAKRGIERLDMTEWYDTAIRSLKAWEEVIEELEEMKCEYDCTTNEFQRGANTGANFIRNKAIDIINQKLEQIEKVR